MRSLQLRPRWPLQGGGVTKAGELKGWGYRGAGTTRGDHPRKGRAPEVLTHCWKPGNPPGPSEGSGVLEGSRVLEPAGPRLGCQTPAELAEAGAEVPGGPRRKNEIT